MNISFSLKTTREEDTEGLAMIKSGVISCFELVKSGGNLYKYPKITVCERSKEEPDQLQFVLSIS
jgi:hypothetical protein